MTEDFATADGNGEVAIRALRSIDAGGRLLHGADVVRGEIAAALEGVVTADGEAVERLRHKTALGEEGAVGAEGKLEDPVAADLVADVEGAVALFGVEVVGVLRDDAVAAADGGSVVDGMAVKVRRLDGYALLQALADVDGQTLEAGVTDGVLVIEGLRVGIQEAGRGAVRRPEDVQFSTLRTVVADVGDDTETKRLLDVDVPDLDVAEAVVLIGGEVVLDGCG